MRPGPGLVVMALAFISGARRASTSSSSSGSSSSSLLLTTTGGTTTDSTTETGTRATTIPPAITTTTATLSATAATLPSTYDSASGSSESFNFNAGGGFTFLLPTFRDGSPGDGGRPSSSDTADHSNSHHTHSHSHTNTPIHSYAHHADDRPPLNFDFYRRPTLHAPNDDDDDESLLASSTRRARSVDEATRQAGGQDIDGRGTGGGGSGSSSGGGTESAAVVPESSEATLISENDDVEPDTEQEQEQEREREEDNSGLPVQYASSRALEEDTDTEADADVVADEDIFALVAEDDLLSEESFDRLIKLSEDAETAAAEEEDYNLSLTQPQQQPQSDQKLEQPESEPEPEPEPESQQQDESRLVDESVLHAEHNEQHAEEESISISNNNKRETGEERSRGNDAYASHLIAIAQRDGGTLAAAVATPTTTNPATITTATTASKPAVDLKKSILGTATAITRLNPWISACDLAQPGTIGTDLQGQCSAGTLPMAWVDEGPGPPICPRSCAEQQPTDSSASSSASASHAADNKVKYFRNANTINYKSRLSHSSSSSSSSSNNNNKAMSRMRREREWQLEGANDAATEMAATTTEREQELELDMEEELEASTLAATSSSSNADELDEQSMPTLLYSHLQTHEQLSANEQQQQQQQQQQPQQQQQQCLDYLGDAAETSPQHLCGLRSPGQLLARLRSLRLRHCCERSVFSALHTLALNATLTDRNECVRLLSDLLEVDALSNRITCELAEILFRFDCRQVYSLINQCDDCKEAYRRWVCSTLVPYFAEPQDVDAAPPPPTTTKPKTQQQTTTPADDLANRGPMAAGVKSKRAARSAGVQGAAVVVVGVGVGGSDGINGIKHKSQKLISNNNKSNNGNNMNERQINQQHDEDIEPQHKATATATATVESERDNDESERVSESVAQAFYNVVGIGQHQSQAQKRQQPQPQPQTAPQSQLQLQPQSQDSKRKDNNSRAAKAGQQQFNNFISTANNADPSAADPVISKLQKRSTRKAEFRKRRRIRPCLSVCQTVEQKCPYLLPADRAPALPTQYAGEPTFVCLDQNIPETGEQLKKSSYGPNDCCYSYCNGPTAGICTICQDFAMPTSTTANANSNSNSSSNASGHRVHNITLTMSSPAGEHARAASVSVALRNVSGAEKMAGGELLERLPYYARHESIYYYDDDDDEGSVMPEVALSDGCAAVPSVSSRCEIPYYASGVAPSPPTQLLVWLSALLGLLSSCGAARQRCARSRSSSSATGRVDCAASCHELLASSSMSSGERERERGDSPRRCRDGSVKGNGSARSFTASLQAWAWAWAWAWASPTNWAWSCLGAWLWVWVWVWPVNTYKVMCRKVRYFRGGSRSKLKIECIRDGDGDGEGEMRSRDSRIINYRDLQQLIRIKCSDRNRNARNYRYFYYYNYNINDWWRRWKWFVKGTIAIGAL